MEIYRKEIYNVEIYSEEIYNVEIYNVEIYSEEIYEIYSGDRGVFRGGLLGLSPPWTSEIY